MAPVSHGGVSLHPPAPCLTSLLPLQAARKRFGIVNTVPHTAFKLVMRKLSSLLPQARTKKEQHLEFCQAMADLKDGRFTVEDKSEIFDLAALAIFKDLQEGLSEAEQEEELVLEEGQLTAQLHHYLPSYWFKALENKKSSMRQQQIEEWDRKVVQSFNELTRSELREDECITEVRKIVPSFRPWRVARPPISPPPFPPFAGAQDRLLVPSGDRAQRLSVDADVHRARPPRAALLLRAVHRRDVVRRQDPQGARVTCSIAPSRDPQSSRPSPPHPCRCSS